MEDVVPPEQDSYDANQFDDDAWDLEEIVNHSDPSTIVTRKALDSLVFKCRRAGLTIPGTLVEIMALDSRGLDVLASSLNSESARLWNLLDTSGTRIVALGRELVNCITDFNELTTSKSALEDRTIVAETLLKDLKDIRTVQSARLCSL